MNTTLTKLFLYQQSNLRRVKAGRNSLPVSTPLAVSNFRTAEFSKWGTSHQGNNPDSFIARV